VLRGGTERGFADLAFSPDGSRLATVGSAPDFLLAVWDWKAERLLLKAKAFAQDVFTVRFSESDAGRLTTSGTGHIRFWRMASTFTGLKLQGSIGKFGRVDLSDVTAFAEMPDGKVLSGSESGQLLLWEGGFIKLTCAGGDGAPAHEGDVGAVVLDRGSGCFVTAGADGALRWWPGRPVDEAEGGEGGETLSLPCLCELRVPSPAASSGGAAPARPAGVVSVLRLETAADVAAREARRAARAAARRAASEAAEGKEEEDGKDAEAEAEDEEDAEDRPLCTGEGGAMRGPVGSWLVLDGSGCLWRVDVPSTPLGDDPSLHRADPAAAAWTRLAVGHGGPLTGASLCPTARLAVTTGADGDVRLWDYERAVLLATRRHAAPATASAWAPVGFAPAGRVFVAGFADGVLRIMAAPTSPAAEPGATPSEALAAGDAAPPRLLGAHKPHAGRVTALAWSSDGGFLATGGDDGTVFLFRRATGEEAAAAATDGGDDDDDGDDGSSPRGAAGGLLPLGFLALPAPVAPGCLCFGPAPVDDPDADPGSVPVPGSALRLAAACDDGSVCCLQLPASSSGFPSNTTTFELPLRYARLTLALAPTASPKPPDEDEEDAGPLGRAASPAAADGEPTSPTRAASSPQQQQWVFDQRAPRRVAALAFSPVAPAVVVGQAAMVRGSRGPAARASAMWMARNHLAPKASTPEEVGGVGTRLLLSVDGPGAGVLHEIRVPEGHSALPADPAAGAEAAEAASEDDVAAAAAAGRPVYPAPDAEATPALCVYDCSCEGSEDATAAAAEAGSDGAVPSALWVESSSRRDTVTSIRLSAGGRYLVEGTSRGRVQLRPTAEPSRVEVVDALDGGGAGAVAAAAAEGDDGDGFVLAGGGDGPLVVLRARFGGVEAAARAAAEAGAGADGAARTRRQADARAGVASQGIDAARRRADAARARAAAAAKAEASAKAAKASGGGKGGASASSAAAAARPDAITADAAARAADEEAVRAAAATSRAVLDDVGAGVVAAPATAAPAAVAVPVAAPADGGDDTAAPSSSSSSSAGRVGGPPLLGLDAPPPPPVADADDDDASTLTGRSGPGSGSAASVADITDSATYSIQQRKLRAEADEREAAAERAKVQVRAVVRSLRAEFARIRADMRAQAAEDPRRALPEAELRIDPVLVDRAARLRRDALRDAERQLAYPLAESRTRLGKLQSRFVETVSVPPLAVRAFLRPAAVATIRAPAVDPSVAAERAAARRTGLPTLSGEVRPRSGPGAAGGPLPAAAGASAAGAGDADEDTPFRVLMRGGRTSAEVAAGGGPNSFADRKRRRLARRAALQALLESRPSDGDADADDEAAVAGAWAELGALPLKAAPGYVVPRHLRMDSARKRVQLMWAEEAADAVRARFNARVLGMARLRRALSSVIGRARTAAARLGEQLTSAGLEVEPHPVEGLLSGAGGASPLDDPAACGAVPATARGEPRAAEASPAAGAEAEEAEAEEAEEGGDPRLAAVWRQVAACVRSVPPPAEDGWARWRSPPAAGGSGGPALGAPADPEAALASLPPALRAAARAAAPSGRLADAVRAAGVGGIPAADAALSLVAPGAPSLADAGTASGAAAARSSLLDAQRRREALLSRVEAACDGFDAAVAQLARERTVVSGDLCSAQLRMLTLSEEWRLLSEMGVRDAALMARLDKAEHQRMRVDTQVAQVVAGIAAREAEADAWTSKQRELESSLAEAVAGHPAEAVDALGRIFRRRIKRRRPGDDDDDSSDSDDGFDVSQLAEMEEEAEEDEDAEDVCPPGVPQSLYDRVLELRGQRLDQEDALGETTKGLAELNQRLKQLRASETTMRRDVEAINRELSAFHAEKQARLNRIGVVVPLRIQQLFVGAAAAAELPDPTAGAAAAAAGGDEATAPAGGGAGGETKEEGKAGEEADGDGPEEVERDAAAEAAAQAEAAAEAALAPGRLPSRLDRGTLLTQAMITAQRASLVGRLDDAEHLVDRLGATARERASNERARRAAERAIRSVEDKADDLMRLKFGRPVNLERLDAMGSGAELARARAGVAEAEASAADVAAGADARLSAAREDLVAATKEGTELLERLSELASTRQRLERSLRSGGTAGLTARDDERRDSAAAVERRRLEALVGAQGAQLAEMRAEISILRRKDGSVYGPLMDALSKAEG